MDLSPFSVALFPNFVRAIIQNFNYLAIDKEDFFIPSETGYFSPNWSGSLVPEAIHFHDEVRQWCLYFKDWEGVFVSAISIHDMGG